MPVRCPLLFFLLLLAPAAVLRAADFKRDIAPIFKAKCHECHSEKAGKEKNGYVFDNLERLKSDIGPSCQIVPGKPEESPLMELLTAAAGDKRRMPPKGEGLTPKELKLMREWIREGALLEKGPSSKPGGLPPPKPAENKPGPSKPNAPATPPEKWTSTTGEVIEAGFVAMEGETVVLKMTNRSQPYRVPLSRLNEESRKRALERAKSPPVSRGGN
ncbi:MAG: Planctomycete cytochrome [Verrucomicrobiales bacterium]|nr:Planctomycete cytochrome [Verrucomicrobiales bacterium]